MAHARRSELRDHDISDMLEQSETEDFIPSDDDLGDVEFVLHESERDTSSESDEGGSEVEIPRVSHERARSRNGRGTRSRGRRQHSRGVVANQNQDRQIHLLSSSGSSSTNNWSVALPFPPRELQILQPAYLPINSEEYNKASYFRQYIDDELLGLIVANTNQTAVYKTGKSLDLTVKECYIFIGISMVMASINYPSIRMYWEKKYRIAIISDAMPRNRFLTLRNSLKLVFDSDITADSRAKDKLWKVRPLIEKVKKGCRGQLKQQCLSIDEMIIPFTGNCGIRIYCPGKPNPVGIKAFVLANPNGLICDFDIYEGATTYPDFEDSHFGLAEKAILALTETLVPGHTIYCDRFFTSQKLIDELEKRGQGCTGTLMKNRIPKDVREMLMSDKEMKKKGRGTSQVVVRHDKKLSITKWFDNKPVILMSSVEAKDDEDTCQRWCKIQKRHIAIKRPRCVKRYNQNMGGVDLADRLLAVCPNRYRTHKWTQRFIAHMIDLSVSNAWLLYKDDQKSKGIRKIDQLRQFKLSLGEYFIESAMTQTGTETTTQLDEEEVGSENPQKRRKSLTVPIPAKTQRTSHAKHLPILCEIQGRCRVCHTNKTFFQCSFCGVRLCLTKKRNCYVEFHED